MSKSVLMSIQPYWGFLIIAKAKGWDIEKYGLHEKTIEVRKNAPKDPDWDKTTELYFSKDKKSLARIPEEYRKEVEALCGKVVAEFTCKGIQDSFKYLVTPKGLENACLTETEVEHYLGYNDGYGWHISDLKVYDQPKDLSEFYKTGIKDFWSSPCCDYCPAMGVSDCDGAWCKHAYQNYKEEFAITIPPQSWFYCVEA